MTISMSENPLVVIVFVIILYSGTVKQILNCFIDSYHINCSTSQYLYMSLVHLIETHEKKYLYQLKILDF